MHARMAKRVGTLIRHTSPGKCCAGSQVRPSSAGTSAGTRRAERAGRRPRTPTLPYTKPMVPMPVPMLLSTSLHSIGSLLLLLLCLFLRLSFPGVWFGSTYILASPPSHTPRPLQGYRAPDCPLLVLAICLFLLSALRHALGEIVPSRPILCTTTTTTLVPRAHATHHAKHHTAR